MIPLRVVRYVFLVVGLLVSSAVYAFKCARDLPSSWC